MDGAVSDLADFFISRAGAHPADVAMSAKIGKILEDAGHSVFLQQWDFANHNFVERMDAALASGARVIAILTPQYLASPDCQVEWIHALSDDRLNRNGRLIVLRAAECEPRGLLRTIAYWDLVPVRDRDDLLAGIIETAIMPDAERRRIDPSNPHWRKARPLIHESIKPTPSFTGRQDAIYDIDAALSDGQAAVITQATAVTGLGGIGKSTLAREYAWHAQDAYAGVWWLNAASADDAGSWEGIEQGLVALGDHYIPGLAAAKDRAGAARYALEFLGHGGFEKPWLLLYDNIDDPKVFDVWAPINNVHVLATTRLSNIARGVVPIEIKEWPMTDAVTYLLAEASRSDLTEDDAREIAEALGCLPLALSHAAAYLRDNTTATRQSYIDAITAHMQNAPQDVEYDRSVYATFVQQVEQAEARAPGARAVLSLAAFYAPDEVPEELFTQPLEYYPAELTEIVVDPLKLEKAMGALDKLSLIEFAPDTRTFMVHRLVQAAARDALGKKHEAWMQSAVSVAYLAFPKPSTETWSQCERLIAHARIVAGHVPGDIAFGKLAILLRMAGTYLQGRTALDDVLPLFRRSKKVFNRLAQADPGNAVWQCDLSVSHIKIGDVLSAQGNLAGALDAFQAALAIADRLAQTDPGNAGWQRDLTVPHIKIGDVLIDQGDLVGALDAFQAALVIADRLARANPRNAVCQHDLSVAHNFIGNVQLARGKLEAALKSYRAYNDIINRLVQADPGNAVWQRDLSVSHIKIGGVLRDQCNLAGALDAHQAALAIADRLAQADPGNADCQRDLSVSQENIGDVLRAQGNLAGALDAFQATLIIADRLAQADPGNAGWQRDLSISHDKIGDVLRAQGNLAGALDAFQAGLTIRDRLALADPSNAGWQRDLSASQQKVGEVLSDQGDLVGALDAFQAALAARNRRAQADPGNADWQADLAVSHGQLGLLHIRMGDKPKAMRMFRAGRAIIAPLAEHSGQQIWIGYLESFDSHIAGLK